MRRLRILLTAFLLLTTTSASTLPRAPEVPPPVVVDLDPRPFGLNSHIASRYPDPGSLEVPARVVARSRAGWAREDFQWFRIESQPGQFDWHFHDRMVSLFTSYDVKILGVLGPSVGWATPNPNDRADDVSFAAPDPEAFARYAYEVAKRYRGQVDHWEIWNEPDNALFWQPSPDPAAYSRLLVLAARAIKQANPRAKVLVGGLNPFDMTFIHALHDNGAWDSFDILNLHPYVDPLGPEDGNIAAATASVRSLAKTYGEKPIWVTELGWSSGPGDRDKQGFTDEQEQSDYLVRAMVLLWTSGVEKVFWYTLKDDPGNPYGLVALGSGRQDYSNLKPSFFAFRTLNRMLGGARLIELRDLFQRQIIHDFETLDSWLREGSQGSQLSYSNERVSGGAQALRIDYNFATTGNDYVVFTPGYRPLIDTRARLVGIWVYGDGSVHTVKAWMQDATGAVVQYPIGAIGAKGWHFISAPLTRTVPPWDRISGGGEAVVFPLRFFALVLDDAPDSAQASGTVYLDNLTALSGLEAYDLRLQRGGDSIDMLWSPAGAEGSIKTRSARATVVSRDGLTSQLPSVDGRLRFELGSSPIYVRHQRP